MSSSKAGNEKIRKIKIMIIGSLLACCFCLIFQTYEYYIKDKIFREARIQSEITAYSKQLYAAENKNNSYLAKVNFQGKTKRNNTDDPAPEVLLEVHKELLEDNPHSTIALLKRLYDNYELDSTVVETVTPEEAEEEMDFLHAILNTNVMKITMEFLHRNGLVATEPKDQLLLLKDIWFTQYSRRHGVIGSSGFENVFLAELKDNTLFGMHNWVYFSEQEQKKQLDYRGYIDIVNLQGNQHLLGLRLMFHHKTKLYNTIFIGTSPELEMSLYTVCFLLLAEKPCEVNLGGTEFHIVTFARTMKERKVIDSAYPSPDKWH